MILNDLTHEKTRGEASVSFIGFLKLPGLNRLLGRLVYSGLGFILVSIIFRILAGGEELADLVRLYSNSMLLWGLASFLVGGLVAYILYRRMQAQENNNGSQIDE